MLLPVLLLVVFGSAFTGDVAPGIKFSQYFLAGMLASGIVYTSFQNLAITIPQERDDGDAEAVAGHTDAEGGVLRRQDRPGAGHLRRPGRRS